MKLEAIRSPISEMRVFFPLTWSHWAGSHLLSSSWRFLRRLGTVGTDRLDAWDAKSPCPVEPTSEERKRKNSFNDDGSSRNLPPHFIKNLAERTARRALPQQGNMKTRIVDHAAVQLQSVGSCLKINRD